MEFSEDHVGRQKDIIDLFHATFTASEGDEEGRLIADLVAGIFSTSADGDVVVFTARAENTLTGCIFFTRLRYEDDNRTVFLLAPVAVATGYQGQGIGQRLLTHGLDAMRLRGVDVVLTYGDPNYYSKVGFQNITQEDAQPPLKLQYPEGWLAQSLSSDHFETLVGPSRCVDAFNNPAYW